MDYTIIRDKIPINSIDAAYMITPETGYINLTRFSSTSDKEFDEAVARMKKEGMKSLILDLRGNGGGYLNTAFELADEFLPAGKLIVYTQGRTSPREDLLATAKGDMEQGKVILLINETSASASEIVAGAIQDWDRGLVMGRRSFGKGLVQRPFQLPDSSQVRLTTARYYTPSGRNIQKPYSEGVDKYYEDYANRLKHGEMVSADSIHFPDSLKFYTSQHRLVYGGGGIMPDIFLPLDTTKFTQYYLDLRRKNVINLFISDYVDKNRSQLQKSYPDFATFDKNFKVDDNLMNDFFALADKQGVKKNDEQYKLSEDFIKIQIKALLAQKLWDTNAFYKVINQGDEEIQKAVKVINDDSMFKKLTSR
jgi:carboxyl-terminal processing protease